MEFLPTISKNVITETNNNYILKINSRDRNIIDEPNPFDFKIKFNKVDTKYTTYYEKGYFGSGNVWIKNDSFPQNTWEDSGSYFSKTYTINNGAVIEDPLEQIKEINVTEIVVPRFIPESQVGLEIPYVEAMACPTNANAVFLRGFDNTKINYIYDEKSEQGSQYNFVEICDMYSNKYYLFPTSDVSNISVNLKKNYILFNNYYTDTLLVNNDVYKIEDISNNVLFLKGKDNPTKIDFLKSKIRLPKYYTDTIWYQERDDSLSKIPNEIVFNTGSVVFDQSGESLITVEFAKNTILEIAGTMNDTERSIYYNYFQITSTNFEIDIKTATVSYTNVSFDSTTNILTFDDLTTSQLKTLTDVVNNIQSITVSATSNNNGSYSIIEGYNFMSNSFKLQTTGITTTSSNISATIVLTMKIYKTYPNVNISESENLELSTFLKDSDQTEIKTKVSINGSWVYGGQPANTWQTDYKFLNINHLKAGVQDLLNQKLFYLSLEPITPSRNLITNGKLSNVIGVFYPSTQSKNYVFLTGQNRQKFSTKNLQNMKDLSFKLLYCDGSQVGTAMKDYSLDYLQLDIKQSNITFQIDQLERLAM